MLVRFVAAATIRERRLFRSVLAQVRLLFESGVYSREASIRSYTVIILQIIRIHGWLVQILRESAGLLQGSRSSVVRASTGKVGGLGFNSKWLPMHFSLQFVSILIYHQLLTTSSYHQLLLISIVTK